MKAFVGVECAVPCVSYMSSLGEKVGNRNPLLLEVRSYVVCLGSGVYAVYVVYGGYEGYEAYGALVVEGTACTHWNTATVRMMGMVYTVNAGRRRPAFLNMIPLVDYVDCEYCLSSHVLMTPSMMGDMNQVDGGVGCEYLPSLHDLKHPCRTGYRCLVDEVGAHYDLFLFWHVLMVRCMIVDSNTRGL